MTQYKYCLSLKYVSSGEGVAAVDVSLETAVSTGTEAVKTWVNRVVPSNLPWIHSDKAHLERVHRRLTIAVDVATAATARVIGVDTAGEMGAMCGTRRVGEWDFSTWRFDRGEDHRWTNVAEKAEAGTLDDRSVTETLTQTWVGTDQARFDGIFPPLLQQQLALAANDLAGANVGLVSGTTVYGQPTGDERTVWLRANRSAKVVKQQSGGRQMRSVLAVSGIPGLPDCSRQPSRGQREQSPPLAREQETSVFASAASAS